MTPAYARLDATASELAAALAEAAATAGVPAQVAHATGLLTVFFSDRPVTSFEDARACDLEAHAAFCRSMLEQGVYAPPSQFEAWFPSLAHGSREITSTAAAARQAFEAAARVGATA